MREELAARGSGGEGAGGDTRSLLRLHGATLSLPCCLVLLLIALSGGRTGWAADQGGNRKASAEGRGGEDVPEAV
jgi:hypothetical protein